MKTYLFKYRYKGGEYRLDIPADSIEEAKGRMAAAALHYEYLGESMGTVPALPGAGMVVRLRCWLHNLFASKP